MYRTGEIEQAFDNHLGGAGDAARKLFKIYAIP
jgi:polar amino acid transport system substrate-binding protein